MTISLSSKRWFGFFLPIFCITAASAQDTTAVGTADAPVRGSVPSVVKPYRDVVTAKAQTSTGLFKTHKIDDRYLFEIPLKMMEKQILVVGRIAKAPVDQNMLNPQSPDFGARKSGYASDKISESVIEFGRGPKNKVFLKTDFFLEKANDSSENGLSRALKNNNLQPLAAAFDIKAFAPDSSGVVIDVTEFINGDNNIFFFEGEAKRALGITTIAPDRSYIEDVKTYPINIEIKTVKTYKTADGFTTYGLNTSLVLLPEKPMKARYADPRVGYFRTTFQDFDINPYASEDKRIINRWRLEPRPEDMEKYKRGELVEPQKLIVIYIDPATPKKWVPYLIQGVNDWRVAFEQAGFKNAIMAKEAPVNDSTWSLENALYSAIVYKPSSIANASGPHIADPRSGEIIETHINWYHSVMDLLYKWYVVQCANADPRARKPKFDDELMGNLIRFVSSHEVGHTLGLLHNFGSSSTVPVENLRNKKWVEANGHTPSIMDYARFNYVAQPEDNISEAGLFPRIGEYDKWAIQYGYKLIPGAKNAEDEWPILNKWIVDSLAKNPRLYFGGENTSSPYNQSEVLSDNPMKANAYGIKNLKAILPKLKEWTAEPNKGSEKFSALYREVLGQYRRYLNHVLFFLGAFDYRYKTIEQPGTQVTFISKAMQKEALAFINEQLFITPNWLIGKDYFESTAGYANQKIITDLQTTVLENIFETNNLFILEVNENKNPNNAYNVTEYINDVKNYVFAELKTNKPIEQLRRSLQKAYVNVLSSRIIPGATRMAGGTKVSTNLPEHLEAVIAIKANLRSLLVEVKAATLRQTDKASKLHLQDLQERINLALEADRNEVK